MDCPRRNQWSLENLNKRAVYHSDEKCILFCAMEIGERCFTKKTYCVNSCDALYYRIFFFFVLTATMRVYTSRRNFE